MAAARGLTARGVVPRRVGFALAGHFSDVPHHGAAVRAGHRRGGGAVAILHILVGSTTMGDKKPQSGYQPTKAEMEEVITVKGTPDEIAAAVLKGGADRKEPPKELDDGVPLDA